VLLVGISHRADAALELDAAALLNDMRGLVGGGVQIWVLANATAFPVAYARAPMSCAAEAASPPTCAWIPPSVNRVGMVRPEAGGDAITVR
jgi:hypothetical protein